MSSDKEDFSVGCLVNLVTRSNTKKILCLILSIKRIYNIPTEDYFFQYKLFCANSKIKIRIWNNTGNNITSLIKVKTK
jgi:alpha-mannosidase